MSVEFMNKMFKLTSHVFRFPDTPLEPNTVRIYSYNVDISDGQPVKRYLTTSFNRETRSVRPHSQISGCCTGA